MRFESIVIRKVLNPAFAVSGADAAIPLSGASVQDDGLLPKIEIESMSLNDMVREARHSDVLAVAPSMPTSLIKPLDEVDGFESQAASASSTWGIEAVGADQSPLDGTGIKVAVLDTGLDESHPAFTGVPISQTDFTSDGVGDLNGHGTHCAGTIFGADVNGIRIGIARNISEGLICKVLGNDGSGNTTACFRAIEWALNKGANVISMSLGIDFPGFVKFLEGQGLPIELATSRALEGYRATLVAYQSLARAMSSRSAFGVNCVVIAASGNESRRDMDRNWQISASLPSATDGILSVGAVGQSESGFRTAPFSNTGVNIVGPGVGVLSAQAGGDDLIALNGTSMATPHAAGVACLWAQWLASRGLLSPINLQSKTVSTANRDGFDPESDPADVGLGMVRAPQTT